MKFQTETGSLYEIDRANKQIRRLIGTQDPTSRQGKDGEWKKYSYLRPDPIIIGNSVLILWGKKEELLEETKQMMNKGEVNLACPITKTSRVVKVENDEVKTN